MMKHHTTEQIIRILREAEGSQMKANHIHRLQSSDTLHGEPDEPILPTGRVTTGDGYPTDPVGSRKPV
jgi:hypothetical protein